jgi:hypothetical protein
VGRFRQRAAHDGGGGGSVKPEIPILLEDTEMQKVTKSVIFGAVYLTNTGQSH